MIITTNDYLTHSILMACFKKMDYYLNEDFYREWDALKHLISDESFNDLTEDQQNEIKLELENFESKIDDVFINKYESENVYFNLLDGKLRVLNSVFDFNSDTNEINTYDLAQTAEHNIQFYIDLENVVLKEIQYIQARKNGSKDSV